MKWLNMVLTFIGLFFVFGMVYFKDITLFFLLQFFDAIGIKEWSQLLILTVILVSIIAFLLYLIFKKKNVKKDL